jgi:hypothetical protein
MPRPASLVALPLLSVLAACALPEPEPPRRPEPGGSARIRAARELAATAALAPRTAALVEELVDAEAFTVLCAGPMCSPLYAPEAHELAGQPDAAVAVDWLTRHGSPAARLYMLWVLRELAPDRVRPLARTLRASDDTVATYRGCFVDEDDVADLVDDVLDARPLSAYVR